MVMSGRHLGRRHVIGLVIDSIRRSAMMGGIVKATRTVMRTIIQRSPKRIRTYFQAEPVKYAA